MNEDAYSAFSQDNKGQEGYVAAGWVKDLKHCSTAELVEELKTREGVKHTVIGPNEDNHYILETMGPEVEPIIDEEWGSGPCTIFVVVD